MQYHSHASTENKRHGFTLIELSIVLVIIGLIVGGVLVARHLITAASIRQLGTQIESYNTAVMTFKGKYNCLPGDCANATTFLGIDSDGCPSYNYLTPHTGTCNGDGNEILSESTGLSETMRFWEMLSEAQLVAGNYRATGEANWGIYPTLPGVLNRAGLSSDGNIQAGIRVYYYTDPLFVPPMRPGHLFVVGHEDQTHTNSYGAIAPGEALAFDKKYDDGLPDAGNIKGDDNHYDQCSSGGAYLANDSYTVSIIGASTNGGFGCALFIATAF